MRIILLSIFLSTFTMAQVKPLLLSLTDTIPNTQINSVLNAKEPTSEKSIIFAVCASLLIPGAGELYAESYNVGKYFTIAEASLWITHFSMRYQARLLRSDAENFARAHAGANFSNKDEQYSINVGNFYSTDEYNQTKSQQREYSLIYRTDIHPDYLWQWDSNINREKFRDYRIHSQQIKKNSNVVIGLIVVNHLISAFIAGKKAAAYNNSLTSQNFLEINTYAIHNYRSVETIGIKLTANF